MRYRASLGSEKGSHYKAQAGSLNSQSSCFSLLSSGILGVRHHAWLQVSVFNGKFKLRAIWEWEFWEIPGFSSDAQSIRHAESATSSLPQAGIVRLLYEKQSAKPPQSPKHALTHHSI